MDSSEYHRYLASREWALKKEAVKQRSGGICERCGGGPHRATHHLTYERVGHELLEDLQGVCEDCHKYLSGKSNFDPLSHLSIATYCFQWVPGFMGMTQRDELLPRDLDLDFTLQFVSKLIDSKLGPTFWAGEFPALNSGDMTQWAAREILNKSQFMVLVATYSDLYVEAQYGDIWEIELLPSFKTEEPPRVLEHRFRKAGDIENG